jgi:hypothetical protein
MNALKAPLLALAAIPPLFLLVAVQYGAITFPFYDHCELVKLFVAVSDGTFAWHDLWAPHLHTRPLVYRAVMLANGLLTDWDIRSEYLYLYGSLYAAFAVQAYLLWEARGRTRDLGFAWFLLLLSVISFSPAAHANHWWSMMCQITFGHFFTVVVLGLVALRPRDWRVNGVAAIFCWLTIYTITNGFVTMAAVALIVQFCSAEPRRPDRLTLFWALNFALSLALYLPGLDQGISDAHAKFGALVWFCLIYLGSPVAYLLHYTFEGGWDLRPTPFNGVIGLLLVAWTVWLARRHREHLRSRSPSALLFLGFTLFALGSAVLTGFGRASHNTSVGPYSAAQSRYMTFAAYLPFGILYLLAGVSHKARAAWRTRYAIGVLFLALSARSYFKSVAVYRERHAFNEAIAAVFLTDSATPGLKTAVYPVPERLDRMKRELKALRIGPYR